MRQNDHILKTPQVQAIPTYTQLKAQISLSSTLIPVTISFDSLMIMSIFLLMNVIYLNEMATGIFSINMYFELSLEENNSNASSFYVS